MPNKPLHYSHRSTAGFSLLETLVALVVLSIGLLGIAALQVEGLQLGQNALAYTKAVNLASDMADRVRANEAGIAAYGEFSSFEAAGAEPENGCADNPDVTSAEQICDAPAMAAYDVWLWRNQLGGNAGSGLPGGVGSIVLDEGTMPATMYINVRWNERDQTNTYALAIQP
ncbi:MAG: type IV pilus modification protein PilV [Pseudomonadota bacterium]